MDKQMERGAFTLESGADWAGVSVPKLLEWVKREDFPAFRSGRRWIIPRDAFARWLDDQARARAQL